MAALFAVMTRPFREIEGRPAAIRYLLSAGGSLVLLLFSFLPLVSFRTGGGDSALKSLFYWLRVSLFGDASSKGAYESLLSASAGNTSLSFYRAVVITGFAVIILFLLGLILSILSALIAFYLLGTEEKDDKSRKIGRIFRVAFGRRTVTLLPCVFTALPFLFPHLLAYYYTSFLEYHTNAVSPFDPLIVAIAVLMINVISFLWASEKEKNAGYDIFRSRALCAEGLSRRAREDLDWEESVRRDAESIPDGEADDRKDSPAPQSELPPVTDSDSKDSDDESLYGVEITLGESKEPAASQSSPAEEPTDAVEDNAAREEELRESLKSLFSDAEEAPKKRRSVKKR